MLLYTCCCVVCVLLQALRAIADKLEGAQGAGMLTAAVHSSAIDFLMNRLPPHPKQLAPKGRAPTLDDKVWCRVTGWCYLLPFEMTGMVCEDDDDQDGEGGGVCVRAFWGVSVCRVEGHWPKDGYINAGDASIPAGYQQALGRWLQHNCECTELQCDRVAAAGKALING